MATEPHGAESAPGMPQLDFSTYGNQIFWLLLTLVVIYFILSRIALPRIGAVLAERQGTITNDIAAAENLKAKADAAKEGAKAKAAATIAAAKGAAGASAGAKGAAATGDAAAAAAAKDQVTVATAKANADKEKAAKDQAEEKTKAAEKE